MRRNLILLLTLLLSACVGGLGNAPPVTVYDFGLPATRLLGDGRWSNLALEVRSPPWFESLNVDYRLAYDDPLKQREYAGSRWAGTPAALLLRRLRQQLGTVGAGGNTAASCLLRVELQEFSQVFDSTDKSRGVLQSGVSLIDSKRQLIAERQITIAKTAATPDARGGVKALAEASDEFGVQLADWLDALARAGSARSCLGTT
jgi:cholesterol transport system auxiliary component